MWNSTGFTPSASIPQCPLGSRRVVTVALLPRCQALQPSANTQRLPRQKHARSHHLAALQGQSIPSLPREASSCANLFPRSSPRTSTIRLVWPYSVGGQKGELWNCGMAEGERSGPADLGSDSGEGSRVGESLRAWDGGEDRTEGREWGGRPLGGLFPVEPCTASRPGQWGSDESPSPKGMKIPLQWRCHHSCAAGKGRRSLEAGEWY